MLQTNAYSLAKARSTRLKVTIPPATVMVAARGCDGAARTARDGERGRPHGGLRARCPAAGRAPPPPRSGRAAFWLRPWPVRGLFRAHRRPGPLVLRFPRLGGRGPAGDDRR